MTTINDLVEATINENEVKALRPILNRLFLKDDRTVLEALEGLKNSGKDIGALLVGDATYINEKDRDISKALSDGDITLDERDILEHYEVAQGCLYPEYVKSQEVVYNKGEHVITCVNGAGIEREIHLKMFESKEGDKFTTLIASPFKGHKNNFHVLLEGHVYNI